MSLHGNLEFQNCVEMIKPATAHVWQSISVRFIFVWSHRKWHYNNHLLQATSRKEKNHVYTRRTHRPDHRIGK